MACRVHKGKWCGWPLLNGFDLVWLLLCNQIVPSCHKCTNSKTSDPKEFKLGIGNDLGIHWKWYCFGVQRSKVKVTRRINAHTVNAQYLPNGKAYEVQTSYTDGARRLVSTTSAVTFNVKGEGRMVTWRVWQVLAAKSRTKRPKKHQNWWEGYPSFKVNGQRSRSHGQ